MSYILDALRRADAQRRQGQAPGLQQIAAAPAEPQHAGRTRRARPGSLAVAVPALLVVAALALGWWWGRTNPDANPHAPAPSSVQPAAAAPVAGTTAATPGAGPASRPTLAPAVGPAVNPTVGPAAREATVAPARTASPRPARARPSPSPTASAAAASRAAAPSAVASPSNATPAASVPSARASASSEDRPLSAATLPGPLRSRVAQLAFGGAVQSQDRRQSFVLMEGQIVREGQTLAPGIVLERIGARSLLLRVDGQAVELPL